jgi:7-keto-8-aminopelargonate synthetase-like enzyme
MDGDIALLNEIIEVTKENGAWLMVDESHAIGVIGNNGEGTHSIFLLTRKLILFLAHWEKHWVELVVLLPVRKS